MPNKFTTTVEACCHYIEIRYWDIEHELTPELEETLTEHGEERARELIAQDYTSGELNCLYYCREEETEEEIGGWWEIND